jgi:CO/xanthine dehydrogenase Mo-binding subunit/carbon monoxide dehydrogenase subunit G
MKGNGEISESLRDARYLGRSLERREDDRLLTGRQKYMDDVQVPGALEAALVRSPFAHARIRSIDSSEALALPGVHLVITGEQLAQETDPMAQIIAGYAQYPLAVGKARYEGEPVAFVVADDRYIAEDAADLVKVDYEPLPVLAHRDAALRGDVLVDETKDSNVAYHEVFTFGDLDGAFRDAEHVVERQVIWRRSCGTPLDTNGTVAVYEGEGRYTLHANLQIPRVFNAIIAVSLRTSSNKLRIVVPPMGGSYGTKMNNYRWPIVCGLAARLLGRPVKFKETMIEQLEQGECHAYDRRYTLRGAFTREGRMTAYSVKLEEDLGAYPGMLGPAMTLKPIAFISGPFDVPVQQYEVQSVLTSKSPQTAYRGFGSAPHNLALASVMQQAAQELGLTMEEIQRRNFIKPEAFPYTTASGNQIDSGNYDGALTRAIELADLDGLRRRQAELRDQGRYLGIGVSLGLEPSMFDYSYFVRANTTVPMSGAPEYLTVALDNMGEVTAFIGTTESGQAYETLTSQIVGEELGIDPARVEVVLQQAQEADGPGFGQGASRMTMMLLGAARGACDKVKAKMIRIAQHALETDEELEVAEGLVRVKGDVERNLPFIAVAGIAHIDTTKLPPGEEPGLKATHVFENPSVAMETHAKLMETRLPSYPSMSYAGVIPVVEVDPRSGKVELEDIYLCYDCGTVVNPAAVDALHYGGIAQAIGAVFFEEFSYSEAGQLLANNLWDYGIPTARDVARVHAVRQETPSPWMPLGAKGAAEGGYIAVPGALLAAINDALEPFGARVSEVPITPERVLAAIEAAREVDRRGTRERVIHVQESVRVSRPAGEVYAALTEPERLGDGIGLRDVIRSNGSYEGVLHAAAGQIGMDFDCRFRLAETARNERVRIEGVGSSARMGFTVDATFTIRSGDGSATVDLDADVAVSGPLAGLGQRRLTEQARKLLAAYAASA